MRLWPGVAERQLADDSHARGRCLLACLLAGCLLAQRYGDCCSLQKSDTILNIVSVGTSCCCCCSCCSLCIFNMFPLLLIVFALSCVCMCWIVCVGCRRSRASHHGAAVWSHLAAGIPLALEEPVHALGALQEIKHSPINASLCFVDQVVCIAVVELELWRSQFQV